MIKKILVGLTGASPPASIQTAVDLARRHDAVLTAVTVVNPKSLSQGSLSFVKGAGILQDAPTGDDERPVTEQMIENSLAAFDACCHEAGIQCQIEREEGDPFDVMISHARYHDLVVVSLQALFIHPIIRTPRDSIVQLVRHGVRPIIATVPESREVRRVLIAYGGSMEAANTMKRFVELRPYGDVELRIVCFQKKKEAQELLEDASEYCRSHGFEVTTDASSEDPRYGLLPYAEKHGADLIVLGNSVRSLITRYMLGSAMLHAVVGSRVPLFLSQ